MAVSVSGVTRGDKGDQLAGDLALAGLGEASLLQLAVNDGDGVLFAVEADGRVGDVVGDDQVEVLVLELARGIVEQVLGFGGKADAERPVRAPGQGGENV